MFRISWVRDKKEEQSKLFALFGKDVYEQVNSITPAK